MRIDATGWLSTEEGDPEWVQVPSARHSSLSVPMPVAIVWHTTDTLASAETLARRIVALPKQGQRAASWHALVGRDGRIWQSVPFLRASWHVGRGGKIGGVEYASVNKVTVAIELENAGRIEKTSGGLCYVYPYRQPDGSRDERLRIDADRAVEVNGKWWDGFTSAQESSAGALLQALASAYGWSREACGYGHRDFDSPRKEDPGPVWMGEVLPRILAGLGGVT